MFTITKNARIHESVASESFSQAEIASMTKERGSRYYVWPFAVDVIGCDEPVDHDPSKRFTAKIVDGYDQETLVNDVIELTSRHTVKTVANAVNRGLDLELRSQARPTPRAKMSDADKAAWVIINAQDRLPGLDNIPAFVAVYNEING